MPLSPAQKIERDQAYDLVERLTASGLDSRAIANQAGWSVQRVCNIKRALGVARPVKIQKPVTRQFCKCGLSLPCNDCLEGKSVYAYQTGQVAGAAGFLTKMGSY